MTRLSYLLLLASLMTFGQLGAVTITYTGGQFGYWNTASNWSTGNVPTANDQVLINCNCIVLHPSSTAARAESLRIFQGSRLHVYANRSLLITPTSQIGVELNGTLSSQGSIQIENPNFVAGIGLLLGSTGSFSSSGDLEIANATASVYSHGNFQSNGDMTLGSDDYPGVQNHGIYSFDGFVINHSSGLLRIYAAGAVGILLDQNASMRNYGNVRVEQSVDNQGISNFGDLLNQGTMRFYGSGTTSLYNGGDLNNEGTIRFYNSGAGTAIQAHFGQIINHPGALIDVYGFNYDYGLKVFGNGDDILNYGEIDIFTGQNTGAGTYVNNNAEIVNFPSGLFNIRTRAPYALEMAGGSFHNEGGEVILDAGGGSTKSLGVNPYSEVINTDCGNILFKDAIEVNNGGILLNEAWMELFSHVGASNIQYGANFDNHGVIHDLNGRLTGTPVDNFQGLIVSPLTEIIYPNQTYYDPVQLGSAGGTHVSIGTEFYGGSPTNVVGAYNQGQNIFTPNPSWFTYEKYYYVDVTLIGCGNRIISMYRNSPEPFAAPASSSLDNETGIDQLSGIGTSAGEELSVFPNPASDHLQIQLSAQLSQNGGHYELLSLTGQRLLHQGYAAGVENIRLDRPAKLPAGTYLLRVLGASGDVESKRILFQ